MQPALKEILRSNGKESIVPAYDYLSVLDNFILASKSFGNFSAATAVKFVNENYPKYSYALMQLSAKSQVVANVRAISLLMYNKVGEMKLADRVVCVGNDEVGKVCLLTNDTIELLDFIKPKGGERKFSMIKYLEV